MPGLGRRLLLGLVVLFLGGSGLVYEYCLSTLATHLLGNSIEQFSLIIALMLFAMGLAGLAQRGVRDPAKLAALFIWVEIGLAVVGGASVILLYLAFASLENFRLVLYGLAMLIGFGIGLEIPLLLRLNQRYRGQLADNLGDVFSLDYLGALVGAVVWAFLLLPVFALDRISLILGLTNMAVAALSFWLFRREISVRAHRVALLVALPLATAGLGLLAWGGPAIVVHTRQYLFAQPVRLHQQSPYQDIVVTGMGGRFSLYLNGRLQFDTEDEFIYHELLVHPALQALDRPPVDVLVLGGGDGLAVREVRKWPSVHRIVLVDLDPAVTALARTWPPLVALNEGALVGDHLTILPTEGVTPGPDVVVDKAAERPRLALQQAREPIALVKLVHLDADAYLRAAVGPYDAIIADFPDPGSPELAKLFSLEFYARLRSRLRPGGVFVVQAGSPYANRRAFWSVADTLEAAGFAVASLHVHIPTFGEWGWHLARVGAAPDPRGDPPVPTRYLDADVLQAARVFPRTMRRPAEVAVSTRLDPAVMRLYLAREPLDGPALFPGRAYR
ncbi:MAG: polyamine aminopropyltransferase [Myxococcales bacterium]|nr:polyamine aminopropyltransferase [Myxococcales bacterium]